MPMISSMVSWTEEGGREGTLWTYRMSPAGPGTLVTEC
jgi:hypothetical protein